MASLTSIFEWLTGWFQTGKLAPTVATPGLNATGDPVPFQTMISLYSTADLADLSLCAWKEARGDGVLAMQGVIHVCLNRVGFPGFAKTLHGVIFDKNQFTSMSVPTDPEYNLKPLPGDALYTAAEALAAAAVAGKDTDPTHGAHFYDNPKTATSGWFFEVIVSNPTVHPLLATIKQQNFYL